MNNKKYTAKEALEIKMAFTYFSAISLTVIIAECFLIAARVPLSELLPGMMAFIFCITLSFIFYTLKKHQKDSKNIQRILSLVTMAMPHITAQYL